MNEELIKTFFTQCKAHVERKFWINRTYQSLIWHKIVPGIILVPRALHKTPLLGVIAQVWNLETTQHRSPTAEEMKRFYDEEMGNASNSHHRRKER